MNTSSGRWLVIRCEGGIDILNSINPDGLWIDSRIDIFKWIVLLDQEIYFIYFRKANVLHYTTQIFTLLSLARLEYTTFKLMGQLTYDYKPFGYWITKLINELFF